MLDVRISSSIFLEHNPKRFLDRANCIWDMNFCSYIGRAVLGTDLGLVGVHRLQMLQMLSF